MEKWGAAQFETDKYGRNIWGCPTDSSADFAWLQHMIKSMEPETGRCAVVLPQGVLFHGSKEGQIREQLIKSDKIEAIIGLANGVFYNASVSACIMFLTNKKCHSHKGRICLIDGSQIFTPQRAQNIISESDAKKLYDTYMAYADEVELCKVVSIADVEAKGFELGLNKYIERKEKKTIPHETVCKDYYVALRAVRDAEEKMQKLLIEGGYTHE